MPLQYGTPLRHAAIHRVAKSQTQLSDWTELNWRTRLKWLSSSSSKGFSREILAMFSVFVFFFLILNVLCSEPDVYKLWFLCTEVLLDSLCLQIPSVASTPCVLNWIYSPVAFSFPSALCVSEWHCWPTCPIQEPWLLPSPQIQLFLKWLSNPSTPLGHPRWLWPVATVSKLTSPLLAFSTPSSLYPKSIHSQQ